MAFDFPELARDPEAYLREEAAWQLVNNSVFSIECMDDKELREAVIEDILTVTMLEKQLGQTLHFGITKMLRFLTRQHHRRVMDALKHDEIRNLIMLSRGKSGSEVRIKDNREILQAAMNYCGVYYSDFEMGENALIINREILNAAVQQHGGLKNLTEAMVMDVRAKAPCNTTLH